jgi:plasmid maintenance system antidote protein VapI
MKYRFGEGFSEAVRVRGLSAQRLAQLAHVSPATVSAALHGRDVQVTTALRIARAVTDAPVIPLLEQWSDGSGRGLSGA